MDLFDLVIIVLLLWNLCLTCWVNRLEHTVRILWNKKQWERSDSDACKHS